MARKSDNTKDELMAGKALFSVGGSSGLVWNDFLEICKACDDFGYHGFYPSDHLMLIQPGRGSGLRLEGLTVMAAMSGHTKNLRLGMLVINNNLRHPVITAKMINTIDHASGGRVEMGIGSGNIPAEFEAHGIPWPKFTERLDRLDESLQVIKALWTEEPASFDGKYYQLKEAPMMPKPIQKPYPPIIIGGMGERTMRVAAKHADDYNQITSVRQAQANIAKFKAICAERLTDDKSEAENFIANTVETYTRGASHQKSDLYDTVEEHVQDSVLCGDIEAIKEQVDMWTNAGINHFILTTPRPFNAPMMEQFAKEIAPMFT
jgi:alkanesulfonate monooxygenase SsuD/methylene tetrahydromethanopterin reductase-like flavin-dependent oxidoreductase (luciferase family)